MATIIQNMACLEVEINPKSKRAYFDKDILINKNIQQVFFVLSSENNQIKSPFAVDENESYLIHVDDIENDGIYLNLFDSNGNQFVKNLPFQNVLLNITQNNKITAGFIELVINRCFDTKKSYLTTYLTESHRPFKVLMLVAFDNDSEQAFDNTVNGSYSIEITVPANKSIADYKLSDFVNNTLRENPIKKIIASPVNGNNKVLSSYLYLKAENSFIENLPVSQLMENSTKEFYFNNLKIDFEQSFFRYRADKLTVPTIQKLTFIY